ncbi:metallophosphoesterase family protein [Staphylococcus saccharolyticus]|uniref:metallophosphoesterase family protein n=1 Tax=Staphylococcus saccharolyticus TaxID=33028 RepID=UPI00102DFE7A|nr:DNA repair exonuclease [Staphylococcus saccharolyticus]MBL7573496.1 DNA repair exonuclease [Staphylococcus saccharolyticus]MBL7583569.1 DNA repair exonuclease [Staphylococcus saccharolyticus]MBL7639114.1 DNA repair exonuclease [Staphylococcus saccharolyticus]QRJ69039.1 DNA repair exonuclease [Staphylococcus saccharolyticus]TAA94024.1 DNA repair exonuclease [Staphylococcus saccharolyticus]
MVKFIHCADLHLDSPFKSKSYLSPSIFEDVQKSAYESFKNIVDLALKQEVDFIIIAGDLFDNENRTLRAEVFLKEQFERLRKEQIFVYVGHGNHDPLTSKISTNWPNNVSVFSNQVETYQAITKDGETIYIHGFSYQNDASYENKIDAYPSSQGQKGIHIGVLHGTYSKSKAKDRYTEFRLEDLNSRLYHYWALGHIHEREQLSDMPVINYPGNIQGRHFNELGEKGCLLVEGDHLKLTTQFYPTHYIKFEEATIETDQASKQGLYEAIQTFKDKVRSEGKAFYRLTILINSEDAMAPQDLIQLKEMITEFEENETQFIFIEDLNIQYVQNDEAPLVNEFSSELIEDASLFNSAMTDLYLNPRASKYLDDYTEFDRTGLVNHAESLLRDKMRGEQNDN